MSKTTLNLGSFGLADGNADKILFFDDSAGGIGQLAASTNLTISGTNVTATGGKILQVVAATDNSQTDANSSTFVDTGLSAAITPSSSSNKVLIIVHQNGLLKESTNNAGKLQLLRGSTNICSFENDFGRTGDTSLSIVGGSGTAFLDSPSTTSETTYKTQVATSVTNANKVTTGQNNCVATITLMEISA